MTVAGRPMSGRTVRTAQSSGGLAEQLRLYLDVYILVASLFATFFFDLRGTAEITQLGSTAIWADDLVTLALGPLVLFILGTRVRLPLVITVFTLIYVVAMLRGAFSNPLLTFLGFRFDTVFFGLLLCVLSGGIERVGYARVTQIFTGFALATCALSLLRNVFGFELFAAAEWTTVPGVLYNDGRTLNAFSVLLLSIAIVLRMCRRIETGPPGEHRFRLDLLSILFLAAILLSGQRTASIGLMIALGFMLCNRYRGLTYFGVVAIILGFLYLAITNTPIDAELIEGTAAQYGKGGTFTYRTLIWSGFLQNLADWSTFDYLFGLPLGERPRYYLLTATHVRLWSGSIHSAYLGTIVNTGFVGVTLLMGISLWRLITAYAGYVTYASRGFRFSPELRLCLAMLIIVIGFSYEWRGLCGFIVGVLVALPTRKDNVAARRPALPSRSRMATAPGLARSV